MSCTSHAWLCMLQLGLSLSSPWSLVPVVTQGRRVGTIRYLFSRRKPWAPASSMLVHRKFPGMHQILRGHNMTTKTSNEKLRSTIHHY